MGAGLGNETLGEELWLISYADIDTCHFHSKKLWTGKDELLWRECTKCKDYVSWFCGMHADKNICVKGLVLQLLSNCLPNTSNQLLHVQKKF